MTADTSMAAGRPLLVWTSGDILAADCDALVNPVNCRGVMGAGLARAIAARWPEIIQPYREAVDTGKLRPGTLHAAWLDSVDRPRVIVNLPTKDDWRAPSTMDLVRASLTALVKFLEDHRGIFTIAVPALGCGLGGLSWADVRASIEEHALMGPACVWNIYAPQE